MVGSFFFGHSYGIRLKKNKFYGDQQQNWYNCQVYYIIYTYTLVYIYIYLY